MAELDAGTLYDVNQTLMEKAPKISKERYDSAKKEIKSFFMEKGTNSYFMLLCKEKSDYTVFHIKSVLSCGLAVKELNTTLKNRGSILSIEKAENEPAFEIWVRTEDDNTAHAYYLFDYQFGIIECY
jgi:hypothetical protein